MRRELSHLHDQPLDLFATALTVLLCAIWGGAFVAIKISILDMPPLGAGAVRFCLTSVVLLVSVDPKLCLWLTSRQTK